MKNNRFSVMNVFDSAIGLIIAALFVLIAVTAIIRVSVNSCSNHGILKTQYICQLLSSDTDVKFTDYSMRFSSLDKLNEYEETTEKFSKTGRIITKLKKGQYSLALSKKDSSQVHLGVIECDGVNDYNVEAPVGWVEIRCVVFSFWDTEGNPFPSENISYISETYDDFSYAAFNDNEAMIVVQDPSMPHFTFCFISDECSSNEISIDPSDNSYLRISVTMDQNEKKGE